ncbi:aminotransferase class V-fold PLP-dependent enzyme [Streptomyces sp. NPDC059740]|uniref:aminotransferase class V-fold PLP-dependent enzyme n=1 Tax=Streptomyces sp. NPDC059740 TaxID=3346926 RepID=UPI0036482277
MTPSQNTAAPVHPLAAEEFTPSGTYLATAKGGLLPARAAAALRDAATEYGTHGTMGRDYTAPAEASRAAFARLLGLPAERVAVTSSVAVTAALVAGALEPGAEVLVAQDDFSSLVTPFAVRPDIIVRSAPLESLADAVGPGTALVAVGAVQALDGRIADLPAITAAARAHSALTFLDVTQAAGWLPLADCGADVVVCGAYKWLMCPRGTNFLAFSADFGERLPWPVPRHAGWVAAADPGASNYGPVTTFAAAARRYDEPHSHITLTGAARSLALVEEIGIPAIHAHDTALAERYRSGLAELGLSPVAAPGSAIVSVPGLADAEPRLAGAGVAVSARAGHLRASFHLYNTAADVDRLLELLA